MHFYRLLQIIANDNSMSVRPYDCIDWPKGYDWCGYDREAGRLSIDEVKTFAVGEDAEITTITDKHCIQRLNVVLDSVFDGHLHDTFFLV